MWACRCINVQGGDDYRRVKQNLSLLRGSRKRYEELEDLHKTVVKTKLRFKKPSKIVQERMKRIIQLDMDVERKRQIRIILISLGIGVIALAFLVYLFKDYV